MNIEKLLIEYKTATEEYMEKFEDLEEAKRLITVREKILNTIKSNKINREELRSVVDKLEIMNLEKKVLEFTQDESSKVKQEMIELKKAKNANSIYSSNFNNINFINKRI